MKKSLLSKSCLCKAEQQGVAVRQDELRTQDPVTELTRCSKLQDKGLQWNIIAIGLENSS